MAGIESLEEPDLKMKLLVDKEKNKVVLATVGKDFVDVLFSFLALPMGTIVRLLEKYHQNQKSEATPIGCFNNLYESVRNMGTDDFLTEACKHALLNTRSVKDRQCRQLKINIDDNEVLKYYRCSYVGSHSFNYHFYSSSTVCSSKCSCQGLMSVEFKENVGNYEIFFSKKKSFIVTDNMEVGPSSLSLMLETVRGLGYEDADRLQEIFIDANHEKVLALLDCLFSSDTPLTDVFLRKPSSYVMTRTHNMSSLAMQKNQMEELSITVFLRKEDRKILYAESEEDFVDLLFTFFALPLESVWVLSGFNFVLGCIGNFCKSLRKLSGKTDSDIYTCMLHWQYIIQKPLFDVSYTDDCGETTLLKRFSNRPFQPMHPNGSYLCSKDSIRGGFVKGGQTYMISDDLTVTPINPSSTLCILKKKLKTNYDDIEQHVINISRVEAVRLLIASLMTTTALTTSLGCLIPKKLKVEKLLTQHNHCSRRGSFS